jgi:DNA-binding IclR family transcriptional regulator
MTTQSSIKVIGKIGQIMRAFLSHGAELHLSEIAEISGIETSTASRLVRSLVAEGLLRYDSIQRTYTPGLAMLELSRVLLNRFTFRELAHRELIALSREHGWLVYLTVLDDTTRKDIVYIDAVTTTPTFMEQSQVGQRRPLHSTATGKLFLAYGDIMESEWSLYPRTSNTITDMAVLREDMKRIRQYGYATASDEEQLGVSGVAVPIFDKAGAIVASLGASTETSRFAEEFEKMTAELRMVANGISSMSALALPST